MATFYLDSEDMRYILQNAGKIKRDGRCINCNGTGWENWDGATGEDKRPGRLPNYHNDTDRLESECETCGGVGFIW